MSNKTMLYIAWLPEFIHVPQWLIEDMDKKSASRYMPPNRWSERIAERMKAMSMVGQRYYKEVGWDNAGVDEWFAAEIEGRGVV
jgi:hypothetical protein